MPLKAGKLRQRVTIQQATEAADAHGGVALTYADSATRWAELTPIADREGVDSDHEFGLTTYKVRFRYFTGLVKNDRLSFSTRPGGESKTLEIKSIIDHDMKRRWVAVLATEIEVSK